jgi:hypothetical protein
MRPSRSPSPLRLLNSARVAGLLVRLGVFLSAASPLAGQSVPTAALQRPPLRTPADLAGPRERPAARSLGPTSWATPAPKARDGWILVVEGAALGALIGAAVEAKRDGVGAGARRGALIGGSVGAGAWLLWWAGGRHSAAARPSRAAA